MYESEKGDLIEADLPQKLKEKSIKNYTIKEEVADMNKDKKDKKEDMTEDVKETEMEAKYVKLGETYEDPDPEVQEAARKHVDMDKEADDEAEMEAETPEMKKKKDKESAKDMIDLIQSLKNDFASQFAELKKQNEELKNDLATHRAKEIAEEEQLKNDMIEELSKRYRVPFDWLKAKSETYKGDFIQDFSEGLQYAFGTYDFDSEPKEDMEEKGLLTTLKGLE